LNVQVFNSVHKKHKTAWSIINGDAANITVGTIQSVRPNECLKQLSDVASLSSVSSSFHDDGPATEKPQSPIPFLVLGVTKFIVSADRNRRVYSLFDTRNRPTSSRIYDGELK